MLTIIDLSHHNEIPKSLEDAKKSGVRGVIHKATESLSFIDSKLQARYHLTKEAELLWGVYHFIRPGNPVTQAEFFVSTCSRLRVQDENTLWALDYEDEDVTLGDCIRFMNRMVQLTGKAPLLYSGNVLKEKVEGLAPASTELAKYRLWLAQYGPKAVLPQGWKNYWLWQYTDEGRVAGINGAVDLNRYEGDERALRREWSGRPESEVPEPAPPLEEAKPGDPEGPPPEETKEVTITLNIEAPPGVRVTVNVTPETRE